MASQDREGGLPWDELTSQSFIDLGAYLVPDRQRQYQVIVDLLSGVVPQAAVIDLCCGEGLLSQQILEQIPACRVYGLDGSPMMLEHAMRRAAGYQDRFFAIQFDLHTRRWPEADAPLRGVVSSLAIHHLEGRQKYQLFVEVESLLEPGGIFVIADLVAPAHQSGWDFAAKAWDEAVVENCLALDGTLDKFREFDEIHWNLYRYFDPSDIDHPSTLLEQLLWLQQAGFIGVDVFWMRAGHAIFGGRKRGQI